MLVGFAAGGNIDNLARVTCARLSEVFKQQFVVENRVGAMGTLAANDVVRSSGDGHTLFWAGTGTVSIFPAMGKPPYSMKDLAPVSLIGTSPQVLIINGKLPIKTLQEFVAWVKPNPKKFAYAGGGGPGSVSNLLMALFLKRAGLEMNAVSYRGTAPALTDIIGGHVPAMFIPLPEALPHAATGAVRMLALSDDRAGVAGEGRSDHRRVRLPGIPRRELERHDGAGEDAARDRRSHRERVHARHQGSAVHRAARQVWRVAGLLHARAVRQVPRRGHRAVGGGGEDRRRDARQRELDSGRATDQSEGRR